MFPKSQLLWIFFKEKPLLAIQICRYARAGAATRIFKMHVLRTLENKRHQLASIRPIFLIASTLRKARVAGPKIEFGKRLGTLDAQAG